MERCEIKHKHGGQTCYREKGHDGLCRSKTERDAGNPRRPRDEAVVF